MVSLWSQCGYYPGLDGDLPEHLGAPQQVQIQDLLEVLGVLGLGQEVELLG